MQIPNVIGNYAIGEKIGEGNYAQVKLATHCLLKQKVALKIINKNALSQGDLEKIHREVKIMKVLSHPNIIRLYQVMRDSSDRLYMVTEYASGGELYSYLVKYRCMEESAARTVFSQLLSALEFCHSHNVVHRDIKLENLLLDSSGNVKLADFGFSNFFSWDGKLRSWCGSPSYAAPEIFEGREYIGPEVDIWSAGVVLYTLVSGCLPFDGANVQELKQRVIKRIYRIHFRISEECRDIISKMIVYEPSKRYTIPKLREHSWMSKYENSTGKLTNSEDIGGVREYVIKHLKANGIDWQAVLEASQQRKFDDWDAMYYILQDQYLSEVRASNKPPPLNSGNRTSPAPSIWFPELQQQSETLRQARDWTCRDLAKVPLSLSSKSSIGSSQMEPQFPRIRTISGQHDTQLALHQQYLNYRRHSLDIFTFQHNMPSNSLNNNNHVTKPQDLLRTPLSHFTNDLAARRASDSVALGTGRMCHLDQPPQFCANNNYYPAVGESRVKPVEPKKGNNQEMFLSSIPNRVKNNLGRRASDGHITFNKPNLDALPEFPGQEHESDDMMLPIPSSFQLSPRQQPRRHSFEPSLLLQTEGGGQTNLQRLESLFEQALFKQEQESSSDDEEEMATEYQRNLGSRLRDLHINNSTNHVEQWRNRNSHYMEYNETEMVLDHESDIDVTLPPSTLPPSTLPPSTLPQPFPPPLLPRQVADANILLDHQTPSCLLNHVQEYFVKRFDPAPCVDTHGYSIRAKWNELEICTEVCAVGSRNGVKVNLIRGDHTYFTAIKDQIISYLTVGR